MASSPQDPIGEAREQLAYSLASTGRFAEAATVAGEVAALRGNDAKFAYCYACLLSLTGQSVNSLDGWSTPSAIAATRTSSTPNPTRTWRRSGPRRPPDSAIWRR